MIQTFILLGCILQFVGLVIHQQILCSLGGFISGFTFLIYVVPRIKGSHGDEKDVLNANETEIMRARTGDAKVKKDVTLSGMSDTVVPKTEHKSAAPDEKNEHNVSDEGNGHGA